MLSKTRQVFKSVLALLFLSYSHVMAAGISVVTKKDPLQDYNLTNTLKNLYDKFFGWMTAAAGGLAIIYIVWSGINYITSGGDQTKLKQAKSAIVNVIIGVAIISAAYGIFRIAAIIAKSINGIN